MKEQNSQLIPWYSEGLRFSCLKCGCCCSGGPGHVWLNDEEIQGISGLLGLSISEFTTNYVREVGGKTSLKELLDGSCVFYDKEAGCQIYGTRPRQCRSWPFWPRNIVDRREWKETCRICPGAGIGECHDVEKINGLVRLIDL